MSLYPHVHMRLAYSQPPSRAATHISLHPDFLGFDCHDANGSNGLIIIIIIMHELLSTHTCIYVIQTDNGLIQRYDRMDIMGQESSVHNQTGLNSLLPSW